jgi:hypothetical protein
LDLNITTHEEVEVDKEIDLLRLKILAVFEIHLAKICQKATVREEAGAIGT